MTDKISLLAFAKINLNLEIVGKRQNGYHDIATVMQSVGLGDKIDISLTPLPGVTLFTENAIIEGENLAKKAAELFLSQLGEKKGVNITLQKNIPLSSGMGGGSTDAAGVLVGLNRLFGSPFSTEQLEEIGLFLGADVPFCILGGIKKAEGLGQILTPIKPLRPLKCIIIKNFEKSSTGDMYRLCDSQPYLTSNTQKVAEIISSGNLQGLKNLCRNDFLAVSKDREKQQEIIDLLYKKSSVLAGLSGSGPTLFGLFDKVDLEFFKTLKSTYKEVYLTETVNQGIKIFPAENTL